MVGMFLATPGFVPFNVLVLATLGIWLAAGSAAAFNHILDQRADAIMERTRARPLPTGQLTPRQAVIFAATLALLSMTTLVFGVNALTAGLTCVSIIGYSVIYTLFLKPATPQNIVIGGGGGSRPPRSGGGPAGGKIFTEALLVCSLFFLSPQSP